jgi:hypothetical protein
MPRVTRLLIDERIRADGSIARSWASVVGERLALRDDDGANAELSRAALERVMCRYGRPLDQTVALSGDSLDFGGGHRLRRLRHHAAVDAEGRDYLVWERPTGEPLAVIATHAAAALRYLALRLAGERSQETEA